MSLHNYSILFSNAVKIQTQTSTANKTAVFLTEECGEAIEGKIQFIPYLSHKGKNKYHTIENTIEDTTKTYGEIIQFTTTNSKEPKCVPNADNNAKLYTKNDQNIKLH